MGISAGISSAIFTAGKYHIYVVRANLQAWSETFLGRKGDLEEVINKESYQYFLIGLKSRRGMTFL